MLDPLAYAAEQAWQQGHRRRRRRRQRGQRHGQRLNNPANDPYVIAVGSDNANGTATTADDAVSSFSNNGDGTRNPDLVAPGDHVVEPACDPGPTWTRPYPAARIGDRLFRGSGTSQAAAVVSGAAALLHLAASGPHAGPGEGAAHGDGVAAARRHRRRSRATA